MPGETSHMHLIDDCPLGRAVKGFIAFPIISAEVHHHTLHRLRDIAALPASGLTAVALGNNDSSAVWVEKHFG